jgi:hypothetical protein
VAFVTHKGHFFPYEMKTGASHYYDLGLAPKHSCHNPYLLSNEIISFISKAPYLTRGESIHFYNIATAERKTIPIDHFNYFPDNIISTPHYILVLADNNLHAWDTQTFEYYGLIAKNVSEVHPFGDDRLLIAAWVGSAKYYIGVFNSYFDVDPNAREALDVHLHKNLSNIVMDYARGHLFFSAAKTMEHAAKKSKLNPNVATFTPTPKR